MTMLQMHIHLNPNARAEAVVGNGGKDAWLRLYLGASKQDSLTLFPAVDVAPEKMAAFVDAFNDIMTSLAPAQIDEAA